MDRRSRPALDNANAKPDFVPPPRRTDVGAVIAKALTAAGLVKRPS